MSKFEQLKKNQRTKYDFIFLFSQGLILLNTFFIVFMLFYTYIIIQLNLPGINFSYSIQYLIYAVSFGLIGFWFARHIRKPEMVIFYLGLIIIYTILRIDHSILSSEIKPWFSWIYPLHAIINASPTSKYLDEHSEIFIGVFNNFTVSSIWGLFTATLLQYTLYFIVLVQLSIKIRSVIKTRREKHKGRIERSETPINNTSSFRSRIVNGWKPLFNKRELKIFWIPIILLGILNQMNLNGFGATITIHPPQDPISLSIFSTPEELAFDSINRTWIENTTEGQSYIQQFTRYNVTIYQSFSASAIDSSEKKEAWADYLNYLWQFGIQYSFDGWCNVKHYYNQWLPMFKAVIQFRTDPLYMDRLHGLKGISGDFEPNNPAGVDGDLFLNVQQNITGEIAWMRKVLKDANLTLSDFKFGSISGIEFDVFDNDSDMGVFFENWPFLDYDFEAPMFYCGGNWMSRLNYYFQLQEIYRQKFNPAMEKRVLLGISGRDAYVAEAGIAKVVQEINIARSWGVKNIGFFLGTTVEDFIGILYCFNGAQGTLNGTTVTISRSNVLDVIMEAVYKNEDFIIPVRSPISREAGYALTDTDTIRDNFNLDFLNMLLPYGYVYYDLYLNLDHNFGITHIICLLSLLGVYITFRLKKRDES